MPDDIKSHVTNSDVKTIDNTSIKGNANSIKNAPTSRASSSKGKNVIKQTAERFKRDVKDSVNTEDGENAETHTTNTVKSYGKSMASGTAYVAYKERDKYTRPIKRIKEVRSQQKLVKTQKDVAREARSIGRESNARSRENIKTSRNKYREIKSRPSVSNIKKREVKKQYNQIKKIEKQRIRINQKKAAKAFIKFLRMATDLSKLKLYAIIALLFLAVILIVMVISLLASPYGIMFTEDSNDTYSVNTVMSALNGEFSDKISDIKKASNYNKLSISNLGCSMYVANWQDIFAIWAIKTSALEKDLVCIINDDNMHDIRAIMWDMITITHYIETTTKQTQVVDTDTGEPVIITTVERTLYIDVDYKSVDEMASEYSFSKEQKNELSELMAMRDFLEMFYSAGLNSNVNVVGSGQFIYPANGTTATSAGYPNYSNGSYHGGVDFPVSKGTPILAAADGIVVTKRQLDYSYGYYIIIEHGNGLTTLYAHNSALLVEEGQSVQQGDIIAHSGSTGNSTGPHLHFEVRVNGNRVNPMQYLK